LSSIIPVCSLEKARLALLYLQRIESLKGRIIKQGKINIRVKRGMRNNRRRRNSLSMLKERKASLKGNSRQRSKREVHNEGKEKNNMSSVTWLCHD